MATGGVRPKKLPVGWCPRQCPSWCPSRCPPLPAKDPADVELSFGVGFPALFSSGFKNSFPALSGRGLERCCWDVEEYYWSERGNILIVWPRQKPSNQTESFDLLNILLFMRFDDRSCSFVKVAMIVDRE